MPDDSDADDDRTLITPAEAADLAGVTAKTLARWSDDGRLVCIRTLGGQRRYRRGDIRQIANGTPA